jgi:hypothetical protein
MVRSKKDDSGGTLLAEPTLKWPEYKETLH